MFRSLAAGCLGSKRKGLYVEGRREGIERARRKKERKEGGLSKLQFD